MGKNRDRESLIRIVANIVVHEILARHTNKSESTHFLSSEIIEYRSQAEETSEEHSWNTDDKKYAEEKALKMIKDKLAAKYSDISCSEEEIIETLKKLIEEIM